MGTIANTQINENTNYHESSLKYVHIVIKYVKLRIVVFKVAEFNSREISSVDIQEIPIYFIYSREYRSV
jgi:hypothetical protein